MNNTIIAVVIGLIIIGGGIFLFSGGGAPSTEPSTEDAVTENEPDADVPENFSGTLDQLFAFGRDVTCTFTQNDEEVEGTGTVYLSGDRMRGDFAMTFKQGGGAMEASTIQKDDTIYSWGSTPFGPFATKVAVQEQDKSDDSSPVDFDETIDYKCSKWRVDNSKFELPRDVNFDDINAEVNRINEATAEMLDLQCGACDDIPDANAQAQCRAALGC